MVGGARGREGARAREAYRPHAPAANHTESANVTTCPGGYLDGDRNEIPRRATYGQPRGRGSVLHGRPRPRTARVVRGPRRLRRGDGGRAGGRVPPRVH